jgi:hypothetical protein
MGAVGLGLYRCLWTVCACSTQWSVLIRSWATPPMTGDIQIERGGKPIQYNQPWRFDWENTLILVAAGHGFYRRLWAAHVCSAQWRALIWSCATPPMTGNIQIEQGASPYSRINCRFLCSLAAARQRRQRGGNAQRDGGGS